VAKKVGAIVLRVDGREIPVKSVKPTEKTGRVRVPVMTSDASDNSRADVAKETELELVVPIPETGGEPNWAAVDGAAILIATPRGTWRCAYDDFYVEEISPEFDVEGAAMRTIRGHAKPPRSGSYA